MAEDFFGRFTNAVVGPQLAAAAASAAPLAQDAEPNAATPSGDARAAAQDAAAAAPAASVAGAKNWTWALGVVVVLALIAVYALH
jgi:hypothetical protein